MDDSIESSPQGEDAETDLSGSLRRAKPPNKKKFEEDVESLSISIRDKETEFKQIHAKVSRASLEGIRTEKRSVIDKLKKIDTDLRAIVPEIQAKKGALDRLQSTLTYRQEHKIDEAIGRLENQLKIQNFKLSEEKKIVAEIDSLRRSKKNLSQFQSVKNELDAMRDRQRQLREGRDNHQKRVNKLRHEEDDLKRKGSEEKSRAEALKREINGLYEQKRKKIQEFKVLEKEFYDNKEEAKKLRKSQSFKKKLEERRNTMEAFQQDIDEYVERREPYQDEINLCNTLINYLQKFSNTTDQEAAPFLSPGEEQSTKTSGWSLIKAAVVTNELEDGKYVLLKKDDDNEFPVVSRKLSKRNSKKGKKPCLSKPVTHTPQIFSQFASLNLNTPQTMNEIPASIEQLQARKRFYTEGGEISGLRVCTPTVEERSEAGNTNSDGISATESAQCEMSRQVSNTESTENPAEQAAFSVLDELVRVSNPELEGMSETLSEKSEDTLGRSNSDSTEHAQSEGESSEQSTNSQEKLEINKISASLSKVSPLCNTSNQENSSVFQTDIQKKQFETLSPKEIADAENIQATDTSEKVKEARLHEPETDHICCDINTNTIDVSDDKCTSCLISDSGIRNQICSVDITMATDNVFDQSQSKSCGRNPNSAVLS
ncbi:hypothetical protein FSP39_013300 [Pinctada imbricata]|uniref:Uncharacterized protein n=1 Tax=Pinctada imbricata TaxID=66713 RepID=A0AA89BR66_PINIB|nr:hypothetical protein FSP39_013300 [Pinctada imbricata]